MTQDDKEWLAKRARAEQVHVTALVRRAIRLYRQRSPDVGAPRRSRSSPNGPPGSGKKVTVSRTRNAYQGENRDDRVLSRMATLGTTMMNFWKPY